MFNPDQVSPDFHKVLDEQNAAAVKEVTAAITPPDDVSGLSDRELAEKIRDEAAELCAKQEYHFAPEEEETHEAGDGHANEIHKMLNQLRADEEAKDRATLPDNGSGPDHGRDDDGDGPQDCDGGSPASESDGDAEESAASETPTVAVSGGTDGEPAPSVTMTDRDRDHLDLKVFMNVPLVELVHKKREYESSLEDIEFTVKAMRDMTNDPKGQQDLINQMNAMERLGLNFKTVDEFYERYEELRAENTRIIALLTEVIGRIVPGDKHSVAFLAHSMVEALNARIEVAEKDPAKKDSIQYGSLIRTRDGYLHREKMDYLMGKIFVTHTIYKLCKDVYKESPAKSIKLIDRVLTPTFNDKGMLRFRKILINIMLAANKNGSDFGSQSRVEFLAFAFTYWLAKLMDDELRTGKAIQVRMFIMNVYDNADPTADYDIPGGPKLHMATALTLLQVFSYIERSTTERPIRACCDEVAAMSTSIMASYNADVERYIAECPGLNATELSTTLIGTHPDEDPEDLSKFIEENLETARQKQAAMDNGEFDDDEEYDADESDEGEIVDDEEDGDEGITEDDIDEAAKDPDPADFIPKPDDEIHQGVLETGAASAEPAKIAEPDESAAPISRNMTPAYSSDYSPDDVDHEEDTPAAPEPPVPPTSGGPRIAN